MQLLLLVFELLLLDLVLQVRLRWLLRWLLVVVLRARCCRVR